MVVELEEVWVIRLIDQENLDDLALGAAILGAGGGGDPWLTTAILAQALTDHGPVRLQDPRELDPDGLIVTVGLFGAPTAMIEQFPGPNEVVRGLRLLEKVADARCCAIMPIEVGGMNALFALAAALWLDIPCLDADAMDRTFPRIDMTLPALGSINATPAVLSGCSGQDVVLQAPANRAAEELARASVREMGLVAVLYAYPMTGEQCLRTAAVGSLTRCLEMGRHLASANPEDTTSLADFLSAVDGRQLFDGVVVDVVRREVGAGNIRGTAVIESDEAPSRLLRVEFQSENVIATEDGEALATTPDLIVMIGRGTNRPVATDVIAVGQHVRVIVIRTHPGWKTADGIAVAGPRAYGYDLDHSDL